MVSKQRKEKSPEEKKAALDAIVQRMNQAIDQVTISAEDMKEYLRFMGRFYRYSMRNSALIQAQFRHAKAVGSFSFFKKAGFFVKKGEKGISILTPVQVPGRFTAEDGSAKPLDKATKSELEAIKQGRLKLLNSAYTSYKPGYVFDISQTTATLDDLPKLFPQRWAEGDVPDYPIMIEALEGYMKTIGVTYGQWDNAALGAVKGAFLPDTNEIFTNPRNPPLQHVKTLIHELTHATLHRDTALTSAEKEFQAELVAVSVCSYFGLDTSDYSLQYLHSWSRDLEAEQKMDLLQDVYKTGRIFIETIEPALVLARDAYQDKALEQGLARVHAYLEQATEATSYRYLNSLPVIVDYDLHLNPSILPVSDVLEGKGLKSGREYVEEKVTEWQEERLENQSLEDWLAYGALYKGQPLQLEDIQLDALYMEDYQFDELSEPIPSIEEARQLILTEIRAINTEAVFADAVERDAIQGLVFEDVKDLYRTRAQGTPFYRGHQEAAKNVDTKTYVESMLQHYKDAFPLMTTWNATSADDKSGQRVGFVIHGDTKVAYTPADGMIRIGHAFHEDQYLMTEELDTNIVSPAEIEARVVAEIQEGLDVKEGLKQSKSYVMKKKLEYGLELDVAFEEKDLEALFDGQKSEKEIYAAIQSHRNEMIVDWSYNETKPAEVIDLYEQATMLHLRSQVLNGHRFYQVGEEMELLLSVNDKSPKEYSVTTFRQTGAITDLQMGSLEEAAKVITEKQAIPVKKEAMEYMQQEAKKQRGREQQLTLQQNRVMAKTYHKETGRNI
ncbi:ImmA/IrrE family metallo-endopeptidase [Listeria rocourtiae]|uniref:ArdC-like ssDNA-binding domain-containing protein n=1 Tax=Listeria rocourtiae TaxID=647910 RepID=UPI001629181B|nr:ArdC-like ssDNA-binding domain-containing protein [Listeria rocourtiae]MBC1604472.1 ImmA/IrrE family metallo-endopeptidase [Listeria rocourtiae]